MAQAAIVHHLGLYRSLAARQTPRMQAPNLPVIEGYEIIRRIGQGGMASVYVAFEKELAREVAIKVVAIANPNDRDAFERLKFEAKSMARLQHPNIVSIYRYGFIGESAIYYVMPLLTGGDLSTWLRPVPEKKVIALLRKLLDALGHAHKLGIVHRDVKPENVLFDANNRPHLADFGAAISIDLNDPDARLTREGFAVGSLGYMSPEQARGKVVTGTSDLYSLAVVTFELLTGERSHGGTDAISLALAQIEQAHTPLPSALSHWQPFFHQALQANPELRFQSAALMQAAIPDHLEKPELIIPGANFTKVRPISQVQTQVLSTEAPSTKRKPWLAIAIGFSLALLGALALTSWQHHQREAKFLSLSEQIAGAPIEQASSALAAQADTLELAQREQLSTHLYKRMSLEFLQRAHSAPLAELRAPWLALLAFQQRYDVAASAEIVEAKASLGRRLEETLRLGIEQYDIATLRSLTPLSREFAGFTPSLAALFATAEKLPAIGEPFVDASGLTMRLVAIPRADKPGLAVMAEPLKEGDFQRFAAAAKISPEPCKKDALRACMDQQQAGAIVAWLNTLTPNPYALPSASAWKQVQFYAPKLPNVYALSSDCRLASYTQRPNVLARTWGGIRSAFGGAAVRGKTTRYCDGELSLRMDGSGESVTARSESTVLVLVQAIKAPSL